MCFPFGRDIDLGQAGKGISQTLFPVLSGDWRACNFLSRSMLWHRIELLSWD